MPFDVADTYNITDIDLGRKEYLLNDQLLGSTFLRALLNYFYNKDDKG